MATTPSYWGFEDPEANRHIQEVIQQATGKTRWEELNPQQIQEMVGRLGLIDNPDWNPLPIIANNNASIFNWGTALSPTWVEQFGGGYWESPTPSQPAPQYDTAFNPILPSGQLVPTAGNIPLPAGGYNAGLPPPTGQETIINSNTPQQTVPGNVTPSNTTANAIVAGANQQLTPAQQQIAQNVQTLTPPETNLSKEYKTGIEEYKNLLPTVTRQGEAQLAEEQAKGIPGIQTDIANLNAQIKIATAEYNTMKDDYEKANLLIENKPITLASISGQQAMLTRLRAADLNRKASDIGLLQADLSGKQGQLAIAQAQVDRAIDLKYKDLQAVLDTKLQQLKLIEPLLTREQALYADAVNMYLNQQAQSIENAKASEKQQSTYALQQMNNYPDAGIQITDDYATIQQKIQNSQTYKQEQQVATAQVAEAQQKITEANQVAIVQPYYRRENENEVYNAQTGLHITAEQAAQIPNFWSQVEVIPAGKTGVYSAGELKTATKEIGNRVILYNTQTGETIADLGTAGVTETEKNKYLLTSTLTDTTDAFNQLPRGTDGYIDPNAYMDLKAAFVAITGNPTVFDNTYASYLSPQERQRLGVGKESVTATETGIDFNSL